MLANQTQSSTQNAQMPFRIAYASRAAEYGSSARMAQIAARRHVTICLKASRES